MDVQPEIPNAPKKTRVGALSITTAVSRSSALSLAYPSLRDCVCDMSAGKTLLLVLGLLVGGLVLVGLWAVGVFNRLVTLQQGTDAAWAQVQNVYQRRADLIPNLVNTVSGAANFEKSTLNEVVNARASVGRVNVPASTAPTDPQQLVEFDRAQAQLGSALSRLLVVVERYPELKATAAFRDLQAQLEGTENRITVERGRFNEAVQAYNTAIKRFPAAIFAGMFGHSPRPYFSATPGADRPPEVKFDFAPKSAPAKQP
jgi:LemA protein